MRPRPCDAAVWAQPMGENNMFSVLKATRIVHLEQRCHDSACRERRHHDMLCARCVSEKIFAFAQTLASFIRADVPYTHAERLSARLHAVHAWHRCAFVVTSVLEPIQ